MLLRKQGIQLHGAVDESHVRECLWEVSEEVTGRRINLFGVEAEMVAEFEQFLESFLRLFDAACGGQRIHEPETAEGESTLFAVMVVAAIHECAIGEVAHDRFER